MSHLDPSQPIALHLEGDCAEIVFNAPARRNAFNMAMWAALPGLIAEAERVDSAKAIILHGGETGHFAAGADISEFETIYATESAARHSAQTIADGLNAIVACTKPVIAAIEGACVGGGVSLALAADIRIASETARFGVTPAKLGLVYPMPDITRLVATVGRSQAKDLLFTGRLIHADKALRIGLVDELTDPATTRHAAREVVTHISANAQSSIRTMKRMIESLGEGEVISPSEGQDLFIKAATGPDFREGYKAFLEKRAPKFEDGA